MRGICPAAVFRVPKSWYEPREGAYRKEAAKENKRSLARSRRFQEGRQD